MNLFKRDDYFTVLLFRCSVDDTQILTCEMGYWHHPQEGITELEDSLGKVYKVIGPQTGYNLLHINPQYELELL